MSVPLEQRIRALLAQDYTSLSKFRLVVGANVWASVAISFLVCYKLDLFAREFP